jgi:hypothetical protein
LKRSLEASMSRLADRQNEVTVMFKEAAFVLALPQGATLGELAARIALIEERQFGEPVSIDVQLRH